MSSLPFVEKRLDAAYVNEDTEFVIVARVLFYMLSLLTALALVLVPILRSSGMHRVFVGGAGVIFALLAVLVLYGKARFSSLASSYLLSVLLSLMVFLNPVTQGYLEFYMIGFMNLFAIGVTLLIGYYSWQGFPVVGITAAALLANLVLRGIPHAQRTGGTPQYDDVLVVLVLTGVASSCLYVVFRRTRRFNTLARDESRRSDRQLGILRGAMSASADALSRGETLKESAARTVALASRASGSAVSAGTAMKQVLSDSAELGHELDGIGDNSRMVRSSAEDQSSVINETSAAVEQMTASILNIANVTRDRRASVQALSKSTGEGRDVVGASATSMKKVESSTGAILDIVKVISSVASQTNLLAMNAAIEAAHAGTYGQGFAVVADEIRKLSEQTSKSVKAVTDTVKATISDIKTASDGNAKAVSAFASIDKESALVAAAMDEIINGLDELSRGTEEINRGVADSVTSTNSLRTAVASLDERIEKARESLAALTAASSEVAKQLEEMRGNTDSIAGEARAVSAIGVDTTEGLSTLKTALERAGL
jgi:methyl-accepting chemotaxis protein